MLTRCLIWLLLFNIKYVNNFLFSIRAIQGKTIGSIGILVFASDSCNYLQGPKVIKRQFSY